MALEYWDQMHREGTNIPNWVFEIFVYVLGMRGHVDEAFQLFRGVQEGANDSLKEAPLRVWFYLLDECSRSFHLEGTTFIWEKMVEPGTLIPPDGICLNVLNTASHHGDSRLATAVIQLLFERRVKLGLHHYEPLLESYVHAGQLEKAFRVLCIMTGAGIRPDQSSTRSIFRKLKGAPERAKEAVGIFEKLRKEHHELPVAAINVLLEVLAEETSMEETLKVYRQVCDLCQSGPNRETFTLLLQKCSTAEPAVFLVSEMDRFSVRPSSAIVDNLIRCFAYDGNLDIALLYLSGMQRSDSPIWVSKRTLLTVLKRCYKEKDPRVWSVVDEARKRGVAIEEKVMDKLNDMLPVAGESG
jgi:pentatricopeptide repeat protein